MEYSTQTSGSGQALHLIKNPKKFIKISYIFSTQTKLHATKYKYKFKAPHNINKSIHFNEYNVNTLWWDNTDTEIYQICDFQIPKLLYRCNKYPENHNSVSFQMSFDIKHGISRNSQLVLGEIIAGESDKDAYCGVTNIDTGRAFFLL